MTTTKPEDNRPLCSWGTGGDWANGCEALAGPDDLCDEHRRISEYLEANAPAGE